MCECVCVSVSVRVSVNVSVWCVCVCACVYHSLYRSGQGGEVQKTFLKVLKFVERFERGFLMPSVTSYLGWNSQTFIRLSYDKNYKIT